MRNARCLRVAPDSPWLRSQSSGLWLAPSCRAWFCDACGPRRARRWGVALDNYGYDRRITITRLASDRRQGLNRLAHLLRKRVPMQWAWSIERGPKTGMWHAHAVVRGGWIENRDKSASKLSRQAGNGFVSVQKPTVWAGRYAAKLAGRYASKGAADYQTWLAWNGGVKPWHWSKGFLDREPRDFVRAYAPGDLGPWRLVPYQQAPGGKEWADELRRHAAEYVEHVAWPKVFYARQDRIIEHEAEATIRAKLGARRADVDDEADWVTSVDGSW